MQTRVLKSLGHVLAFAILALLSVPWRRSPLPLICEKQWQSDAIEMGHLRRIQLSGA